MRVWLISVSLLILLTLSSLPFAAAEVVSFRRSYGGASDDMTFDIFVGSDGTIYTVGETFSFGSNPPNAFLTIFNNDNSHRCSVSLDLGSSERAVAVKAFRGKVYVLGKTVSITILGPNPDHFVAEFDDSCNLLNLKVFDIGLSEEMRDLTIEPGSPPSLYIVGGADGVYLAKLDSGLNVAWALRYKVRSGSDVAAATYFSNGLVYVGGFSYDGSSRNMFLSVFQTNGFHVGTRELASSNDEEVLDVATSGGDIYLAGYIDYPGRQKEVVLAKLDSSLTLQWVRAFGTASGKEVAYGLAITGPIVYVAGLTDVFGTEDALLAGFSSGGGLSHTFFITGGQSGDDAALSATPSGTCVYFAGRHVNWPLYYVILDGQVNSVTMTVNTLTPQITQPAPSTITVTHSITSYTPTIDSAAAVNSFYAKFCPDALVSTTVTTSIITQITTTTATSVTTSTTTTTAYQISTTTLTQAIPTTTLVSQTILTTVPVTTTISTIETLTTTLTGTATKWVTETKSTTQTLTAITTVVFPEPISTYIFPTLLVVIALLLATMILMRRRKRLY